MDCTKNVLDKSDFALSDEGMEVFEDDVGHGIDEIVEIFISRQSHALTIHLQ